MDMDFIHQISPNFDSRDGVAIDMLVLHYTDTKTAEDAIEILTDPASKVSSHYLIDTQGAVYLLVDEEKRAWHAGVSHWRGQTNINHRSIGIELQNPGHSHGYKAFPDAQMHALIRLCRDILQRYAIPPHNVVGHSDIAPERKKDPGELFDWERLASKAIGLWPSVIMAIGQDESVQAAQAGLAAIGYNVPQTGEICNQTRIVIEAFQRHYRPSQIDGAWDTECASLLASLLRMI